MRPTRLRAHPLFAAGLLALVAAARADSGARPLADKAKAPATGPLDRDALDAAAYRTLRDVINQGADLYNGGDMNGCYRLYEGALLALRPLLDHRPNLQEAITAGIASAQRTPQMERRPFVLREVMDRVRAEVRPRVTSGPSAAQDRRPDRVPDVPGPVFTLWDRLGGETGVGKVVDELLATAAADPKVDFSRGGKYKPTEAEKATLRKRVVEFVSEAAGGPLRYTGRDMKTAHAGMKITAGQFDAFAADLRKALEKNGVKADDVKAVLDAVGKSRKDVVEEKRADSGPPDVPKESTGNKPVPPPAGAKTLWERLGGERGVARVVDDFYAAAVVDPKVQLWRDANPMPTAKEESDLKKKIVNLLSEWAGGPLKYDGLDMKAAHKGMKITDSQFDAFAGHFKAALEKNGAKPDDVIAVMAEVAKVRKSVVEVTGEKKPAPTKPQDKKPGDK